MIICTCSYIKTEVRGEKDDDEFADSDGYLFVNFFIKNKFNLLNVSGETLGLDKLVFSLLDIIDVLIESNKFCDKVCSALPDFLYLLILYMQICDDKVKFVNFDENYVFFAQKNSKIT